MVNERFVISLNKGEVSIIDTTNISGVDFRVDFEDNEEVASYVAEELYGIVRYLNEQDKVLKRSGLSF